MEWLIVAGLVVLIFFITRKYDNEIKMLNAMIELNRDVIDENKPKVKKTTVKKDAKETVGAKKRVTKKSTAKKPSVKKVKPVAAE